MKPRKLLQESILNLLSRAPAALRHFKNAIPKSCNAVIQAHLVTSDASRLSLQERVHDLSKIATKP